MPPTDLFTGPGFSAIQKGGTARTATRKTGRNARANRRTAFLNCLSAPGSAVGSVRKTPRRNIGEVSGKRRARGSHYADGRLLALTKAAQGAEASGDADAGEEGEGTGFGDAARDGLHEHELTGVCGARR